MQTKALREYIHLTKLLRFKIIKLPLLLRAVSIYSTILVIDYMQMMIISFKMRKALITNQTVSLYLTSFTIIKGIHKSYTYPNLQQIYSDPPTNTSLHLVLVSHPTSAFHNSLLVVWSLTLTQALQTLAPSTKIALIVPSQNCMSVVIMKGLVLVTQKCHWLYKVRHALILRAFVQQTIIRTQP